MSILRPFLDDERRMMAEELEAQGILAELQRRNMPAQRASDVAGMYGGVPQRSNGLLARELRRANRGIEKNGLLGYFTGQNSRTGPASFIDPLTIAEETNEAVKRAVREPTPANISWGVLAGLGVAPGVGKTAKMGEAFENWFKGSKVVDEAGEPLVVYHGTGADIDSFEGMVWGSRDQKLANDYASLRGSEAFDPLGYAQENVLPIYMSIKTPFNADRLPNTVTVNSFFNEALKQAKDRGKRFNNEEMNRLRDRLENIRKAARREEAGPHFSRHDFWNGEALLFGKDGAQEIRKLFEDLGFDGIHLTEKGSTTFGAFKPTQIKSKFNKGTFDPNDPRILYGAAGLGGAAMAPGILEQIQQYE